MNKSAKIFFTSLTKLSFQKMIMLLRTTISHPLFTILSFYATIKAYAIAQEKFSETNSSQGIGNAFRHSLWCCFILMYCCKISSPKKSLLWCKKITDLHEVLFPNAPLETKMDLHNNKIGMEMFMEMLQGIHRQFFETHFFVDALLEKTKTAQILKNGEENLGNEMVYLE